MNTSQKNGLIWVDLETTGLDIDNNMLGCRNHLILEVGIHITDEHLNIIDEGLNIIIHHDINDIKKISDPKALHFHEKSGLLDKVVNSKINLSHAEDMAVEYILSFNIEPKSSPICGNNVSFDKNFIDAQMPKLAEVFHYRKLDVSSFKELFNRLNPENQDPFKKQIKHRALDDIKESIDELKLYQSLYFK